MNKNGYRHNPPPKRKKKKHCGSSNSKLGFLMMLLGIMAVLALCLPLKYWVILLSLALIVFGIILLKK